MIERAVQLVDGVRAERITHFRSVEGDANGALTDVPVVRDVGEVLESGDRAPELRVEGHLSHDRGTARASNGYLR